MQRCRVYSALLKKKGRLLLSTLAIFRHTKKIILHAVYRTELHVCEESDAVSESSDVHRHTEKTNQHANLRLFSQKVEKSKTQSKKTARMICEVTLQETASGRSVLSGAERVRTDKIVWTTE